MGEYLNKFCKERCIELKIDIKCGLIINVL